MKNSFIQRLISNPLEVFKKGILLLRYRKSKLNNKKLLNSDEKVSFHYGVWGIGNAGDTVLYKEVERSIQKKRFFQRDLNAGELNKMEIDLLNQKGDLLVLGGGGLFLRDTNSNSNSGWQFNVKEDLLDKLTIPLAIFAVGYNRFRGQKDFDEVFESHLLKTISKASFIGLRNNGSIAAIKSYLPDDLKSKIKFQPCPTTIIKQLNPSVQRSFDFSKYKDRKLVVNIAFDREEKRFQGKFEQIIQVILNVCDRFNTTGWKVEFTGHCKADKKIKPYIKGKYLFKDLTYDSYKQILNYYRNVPITIGMRGHAQMIPFGIGNGIISLISHDKMKWFLEDIEHAEWGVEILAEDFEINLKSGIENIITNFDQVQKEISIAQEKLYQVTMENVKEIQSLREQ